MSKMISNPMVCLAQTVHLSCDKISTITKRTEIRFHMTHVTLEYHQVCPKLFLSLITTEYHRVCPKMISEPTVRSAQTVHLCCVRISTISKLGQNVLPIEPRNLGVRSGVPKMILSLWYIWCKPCTYLALRLTPSPNGPKRDSIGLTSPRSSIGCVQKDF
jgi:hypothetical protein